MRPYRMLAKTFETIDALEWIIANPWACPTRPNIPALRARLARLEARVDAYCHGMGC